jgi:ABC-type polysaccharide/polyol phosphate export permease
LITCASIIYDRLEGVWYRNLLAGLIGYSIFLSMKFNWFFPGIEVHEMIISHVIISGAIAIIHFVIMTLTAIILYDIPNNGNTFLLLLLSVLQSLSGMCCGICISTICRSYRSAIFLTNSFQMILCFVNGNWFNIFVIWILISFQTLGSVWPIGAQPIYMQYFFNIFQFNHVTRAFRKLLFNKLNFWSPTIYLAFGLSIFWMFVFLLLSIILLKIRK